LTALLALSTSNPPEQKNYGCIRKQRDKTNIQSTRTVTPCTAKTISNPMPTTISNETLSALGLLRINENKTPGKSWVIPL
jgi:hypothetical protein